jgi:hypothetical protein
MDNIDVSGLGQLLMCFLNKKVTESNCSATLGYRFKKKSEEVLCPNRECKETVTGLNCFAMLGFGSLNSTLTMSLRSPTSSAKYSKI